MNNTTLFSSVVPLRPQTPGPGLCRSVFSRPVCPYAIVSFDPVTRDVTILPGAVPAGAARPTHSLGEGDDRGGHGSLEGVGGLKTNEVYHSKADALVIPEM